MDKNLFDQPVKNDLRTYDNIRKISTGQKKDFSQGTVKYCEFILLQYNISLK